MTLNRRDQILKYIVEYFIRTAEPVGSQTLIDEYHLSCSSATVRNEMLALEEMGLIEKTHSSSGRVPSSEGYRFYCEYLRDRNVDSDFKNMVQSVLEQKTKSIENVISESCEILSHMTSLASVVLGPKATDESLAKISLIPLSEKSATVVFVTNKGYVENKTFVLKDNMRMEELEKCIELLNDRLVGTSIASLTDKMSALKPLLTDLIVDHDVLYEAIMEAFIKFAADRLDLYGKDELLDQPEFKDDAESLKKIMKILDNPSSLKKTSEESEKEFSDGNVTIHIGHSEEGKPGVSIVTTKINFGDKPMGTLALVGPKRMDYDKVITSLEYIIKEIEKYYKEVK